uniref:Uncharacterized protein n=1 Tax=Anguilla anguilla TaxID=7936 RepID=A0A0E9TGU3_ANGAN
MDYCSCQCYCERGFFPSHITWIQRRIQKMMIWLHRPATKSCQHLHASRTLTCGDCA